MDSRFFSTREMFPGHAGCSWMIIQTSGVVKAHFYLGVSWLNLWMCLATRAVLQSEPSSQKRTMNAWGPGGYSAQKCNFAPFWEVSTHGEPFQSKDVYHLLLKALSWITWPLNTYLLTKSTRSPQPCARHHCTTTVPHHCSLLLSLLSSWPSHPIHKCFSDMLQHGYIN